MKKMRGKRKKIGGKTIKRFVESNSAAISIRYRKVNLTLSIWVFSRGPRINSLNRDSLNRGLTVPDFLKKSYTRVLLDKNQADLEASIAILGDKCTYKDSAKKCCRFEYYKTKNVIFGVKNSPQYAIICIFLKKVPGLTAEIIRSIRERII